MTLREKQSQFVRMFAMLVVWGTDHGYEFTYGESYAKDGHREGSLHYIRLAVDVNVFKDGLWLRDGNRFIDLGEYWESIGGSWGGRFSDGNHFSYAHGGMR